MRSEKRNFLGRWPGEGETYSFSVMSYNNPIVFTTCPIVFHDVDKKYPIFAMD